MKGKLTYANVMATTAVVLALGGGVVVAADKIGARDIKKNAVRSKHIKAEAVKSSDVGAGIPRDVVVVTDGSGGSSANKAHEVECPGDRLPIGGGAATTMGATGRAVVEDSRPAYGPPGDDISGWIARGSEVIASDDEWELSVTVICARGVAPPD